MQFSRRDFVKRSALIGASLALPWKLPLEQAQAQVAPGPGAQIPLPGSAIPQFVDPLPTVTDLGVAPSSKLAEGGVEVTLEMREFEATPLPSTLVLPGKTPGVAPKTWVWGYLPENQASRSTHLGPVILATRGEPTQVRYRNCLPWADPTYSTPGCSKVKAWVNSTDQTLAWADPTGTKPEENHCAETIKPGQLPVGSCAQNYFGPIPACPHIHGGEVPAWLDGGPDSWWTADGKYKGHAFYSRPGVPTAENEAVYRYPNLQEAAPIWFHDHTLGATRLNVYAGLAGGYVLQDPANTPPNLPPLTPLIIQDRMFDTEGQLCFPAGVPHIPNPEHPYWVPEFQGDTILVNGKVWPYMAVESKRYTFLFVNGSNARAYELFLTNQATQIDGPALWQIGTDGGYLDKPVKIDPLAQAGLTKLVLMPGERATVIIDFKGLPVGTTLLMRNVARFPFPNGATPSGKTTGRIMQFRVVKKVTQDSSYNPASLAPLRTTNPLVRLVDPVAGVPIVTVHRKRTFTLNEVMGMPVTVGGIAYPGGPLEVLVNNTKYMGKSPRNDPGGYQDFTLLNVNGVPTFYSELPIEGETELWEIINLTADAHPMHTHLTQVQVVNRQNFDVPKYLAAYMAAFPLGVPVDGFGPPLPYGFPNGDGALGGNPAVSPFLKGAPTPAQANEAGWKDTIQMYPGQVTRILVRFAPTDLPATTPQEQAYYPFDPNHGHGYVWHCHIVDHEDNEMMRPVSVQSNPAAAGKRVFVEGRDY